MKILHLVKPESSEIKFEVSKFPDGQQDVKILNADQWARHPMDYEEIVIKSRFNNFKDLELIVCATQALRRLGVKDISLFIPYLLGARSDRQFVSGGTSYLVDVIAPILNEQQYTRVTVLDVHSDVAAACINNLVSQSNQRLVDFTLLNLYPGTRPSEQPFVLVSPDAGSLKKVYKIADSLEYKGDVIVCSKFRNWKGEISRVDVGKIETNQTGYGNKDFLIIDDICDGGRTFIGIAEQINRVMGAMRKGKIYLVVTHGIFSAGFQELEKHFDNVFCTNSVGLLDSNINLYNAKKPDFLKQLDIF